MAADRPAAAELRKLAPSDDDASWKVLTDRLIHEMYVPVTQSLARRFEEVAEDVSSETEALTALARDVLGVEPSAEDLILSDVEVNYSVWLPVAETTVLLLLDWLVDEVRNERFASEPLGLTEWVSRTMKDLYDPERFWRLTALDRTDAEIALDATAMAITSWKPIEVGVPLRYLGTRVVVNTPDQKSVLCVPYGTLAVLRVPASRRKKEGGQWRVTVPEFAEFEPLSGDLEIFGAAGQQGQVALAAASHPVSRRLEGTRVPIEITGNWSHDKSGDRFIVRPSGAGEIEVSIPTANAVPTKEGDLLVQFDA